MRAQAAAFSVTRSLGFVESSEGGNRITASLGGSMASAVERNREFSQHCVRTIITITFNYNCIVYLYCMPHSTFTFTSHTTFLLFLSHCYSQYLISTLQLTAMAPRIGTAIVTGGSGAIGMAVSSALAAAGVPAPSTASSTPRVRLRAPPCSWQTRARDERRFLAPTNGALSCHRRSRSDHRSASSCSRRRRQHPPPAPRHHSHQCTYGRRDQRSSRR